MIEHEDSYTIHFTRDRTDLEMTYSEIIKRYNIDMSNEKIYDYFKRLVRRCYHDIAIINELLLNAEQCNSIDKLLRNCSFVAFRNKDDKLLIKSYLEYKVPDMSLDEINMYVDGMSEDEIYDYFDSIVDFMRTEDYGYIIAWDYIE